jgi:DNA-binding beta-propeller fold protein YncE
MDAEHTADRCRHRSWSAAGLAALLVAAVMAACSSAQRPAPSDAVSGYSFWPPLPDEPRIQYLTSYEFSSDVEPPQSAFDKIVFGNEREVIPIGKPYGVAVWQGRIYVCDIVNPGVVILDLANRQTRIMFTRRGEPMVQPTDIAIAPDGGKYVVDRRVNRIFVFDAEDRHIATFGPKDVIPSGIAVHGDELYVPDLESQRVLVLDRFRGSTLRSIGAPGGGRGQFISPVGVEVDASGNVYVTDPIRGRLQKFGPEGDLVFALGEIGDAPGNFVRPKHVAVDDDGIIYVVDAAFQNVQMFDEQGELLMFFGSAGVHAGSMNLPAGIAVSDSDVGLFEQHVHPAFEARRIVLVTNQFGVHKVAVYAFGRLKEGRTIDDIAPYAMQLGAGTAGGQVLGDPVRRQAAPPDEGAGLDAEPPDDGQ